MSTTLQHSHDNSLARVAFTHLGLDAAIFVHVPRFAAYECLIDFTFSFGTADLHHRTILHGLTDSVQHKPSGLLRDSKVACDFATTHAILAIRNQPHRREPFFQPERRVLKDRANLDGELLPALFALPPLLGLEIVVLFVTASWAYWTIRPAHCCDGLYAGFLISEVPDNLSQSLWRFHESDVADSPWLVNYIIA